MKIQYKLTPADFGSAFRLHICQSSIRVIGIAIWPLLTILCILTPLILGPQSRISELCISVGWIFLSASVLAVGNYFYNVRHSYKNQFHQARTEGATFVEMDEDIILYTVPGISESKFSWNAIIGVTEGKKVILFYVSKGRFLIVPTRALPSPQHAELDGLVARHVTRKRS